MMTVDEPSTLDVLKKPLRLPCGVILKNRLAKSCMSDSLGDGQGKPTEEQIRLYERWAEGGVGLSCIGEVQTDSRYPEKPGNLVLASASVGTANIITKDDDALLFQELARRGTIDGAHLWPQLGHAGALTHIPINPSPKGPSAIHVEGLDCDALSRDEIQRLPPSFAQAAQTAKAQGFTGVWIHAGHGFLLSQFLSPLFNQRDDDYGGGESVEGRCRLILEVIQAVRTSVGPSFPVGIRINATDQLEGGLTEADALEVVRSLDQTSIDLIDISGGTYFPGAKSASHNTKSGPYFLDFARQAKQVTSKPLMLTGGFKKRQQALEALTSGAADVVGIARAMALNPALANDWMATSTTKKNDKEEEVDPTFPRFDQTVPGGVTAWYTMRLTAVAEDREDSFDMDLATAAQEYDERDAKRTMAWKQAFGL